MPKLLHIGLGDAHIREVLAEFQARNLPLEIIQIEPEKKPENTERVLPTIEIKMPEFEPDTSQYDLIPDKKGIGQKAQWANKPYKRKRK